VFVLPDSDICLVCVVRLRLRPRLRPRLRLRLRLSERQRQRLCLLGSDFFESVRRVLPDSEILCFGCAPVQKPSLLVAPQFRDWFSFGGALPIAEALDCGCSPAQRPLLFGVPPDAEHLFVFPVAPQLRSPLVRRRPGSETSFFRGGRRTQIP